MTLDTQTPTSFCSADPRDIGRAKKADELRRRNQRVKSGSETWSCAWAPDCSYFAWSSGGGVVNLVPWDRTNNCVLEGCQCSNSNTIPTSPPPVLITGLGSHGSQVLLQDYRTLDQERTEQQSFQERELHTFHCGDIVYSLAFGSGTSLDDINLFRRFRFQKDLILATGLFRGKIKLWDVCTGHLLMELMDHRGLVRGLSFSPDGSLNLISCSNDGSIKFWDLNRDGNMSKTLRFPQNVVVMECKWSPNSKMIAAVGHNKTVCIWESSNLQKMRKLAGHYHNVVCCDFSPDSALLATASYDTRVILWDPYTGDPVHALGHLFPPPRPIYAGGSNDHFVRGVSFSPDGLHVSTVADDDYVRFWNLGNNDEDPEAIAERSQLLCCAYSPNGAAIAAGTREGAVAFYTYPKSTVSLQHLCRMAIRQHLPVQKVDFLNLPVRLKEFLKYRWM